MELPSRLRAAIDEALEGVPLSSLQASSSMLTRRYRAETRDGRLHLSDELAVKAYLATRMPATFAAIRTSFAMLEDCLPGFSPRNLLDIGAGPGTVLWAASEVWSSLSEARMIEASAFAARMGRALARELPHIDSQWLEEDASRRLEKASDADLVALAYVLDELSPEARDALVLRLWTLARKVLVIVEPGTPAGWKRVMRAREVLLDAGARIAAPCPHEEPCPLRSPDWCHFSRRVARTRIHRVTKGGDVPWEDEKFIFLAATRSPPNPRLARVIAPPRQSKGRVDVKLCVLDGTADFRTITKRDGDSFRIARRADWGDAVQLI